MKAETNQRASCHRTEITPVMQFAGYIPCDIWRDSGIVRGILKFICIDYRIPREILSGKQCSRPSKPR
jgi:hypothetical protein